MFIDDGLRNLSVKLQRSDMFMGFQNISLRWSWDRCLSCRSYKHPAPLELSRFWLRLM